MKKPVFSIVIVSLFGCASARAQVRHVTGLIIADSARLNGAVVKSRNTQTVSNDLGEFSIQGKKGDTLIIAKENYCNDTLAITDEPYFVIRLKRNPLLLKEVIINGKVLTPESKLAESKAAYKEIYRKGDKSNAVVITPIGVGVVVDKVWSAVSKEGADARRLQRTFNADYKNSIIDRHFTKSLVSRVTGLKGERLFNFMSKYRPTYEMCKNVTEYELIQYLKKILGTRSKTSVQ